MSKILSKFLSEQIEKRRPLERGYFYGRELSRRPSQVPPVAAANKKRPRWNADGHNI